jgi:hypothetical protein
MRTPASIFTHPIHPMLIVFPIGLWIFSLACDLIRLAGASGDAWSIVALFSMVGGFIGALCAAVPGFIDLLFYKGGAPPVKKNSSSPYGDQSHRRRAVRGKYLAASQRPHQYEHKHEHSRSAFDYRRSAHLCIRLAWRPNGARLWRRSRRAGIATCCNAYSSEPGSRKGTSNQ